MAGKAPQFPFGMDFVHKVAVAERRELNEAANYCPECYRDLNWNRITITGATENPGELLKSWLYAFCTGKDCGVLWICG